MFVDTGFQNYDSGIIVQIQMEMIIIILFQLLVEVIMKTQNKNFGLVKIVGELDGVN